ncbi:Copper amine oxidase N-terminal domain-containing protein [Paenibacillus sp. UNC496MF]|uniref:copper amine oxidase N-terminal domain-containing protein n=1 Tax=Paenibacillus sp. UNC496MF TaxID=1502753 RepID=UPI0008E937EE|nr:copper amine oxidase N-terminal domain-containing protein [Paenibacillus sp. UNC496MF]SFJ23902.1 Copper amine oxidase N-terminal domain-containing protein [Paenibacillus sp. UNC496MF]
MSFNRLRTAALAVLLAFGTAASAGPVADAAATRSAVDADEEVAAVPAAPALPAFGIAAGDVAAVHFHQADQRYLPLFASREADHDAIAKTASVVNRLIGKAELTKERLEGEEHFFAVGADIDLAGETDLSLEFKDRQHVLLYYGPDVYLAADNAAMDDLATLMALPPRSTISTLEPAIGETLAIRGSDGFGQSGIVNVFVETPGASGGYTTAKGMYFPSKRALLVYSGPMREARYALTFVMPAYGETIDGAFKPVPPGEYSLDLVTDAGNPSFPVRVAAPAGPQLAINGVPAGRTALAPVVSNGAMLLPMRALAEAFGWRVTWDAAHKAAMIASQPKPPAVNPSGAGELSLWVNGKRLAGANAKPVLVKGSVYLPLRATADALGLGLTWTPAVNGALLTFKPAPLQESAYAGDPRKLAAVKVLNGYVEALNARNGAALEKLFAKDALPAPDFGAIGQRFITGIRAVTFQNRPGGALLADVTFGYLFDPRGNRTGGAGLVLTQEDGAWRIADVD